MKYILTLTALLGVALSCQARDVFPAQQEVQVPLSVQKAAAAKLLMLCHQVNTKIDSLAQETAYEVAQCGRELFKTQCYAANQETQAKSPEENAARVTLYTYCCLAPFDLPFDTLVLVFKHLAKNLNSQELQTPKGTYIVATADLLNNFSQDVATRQELERVIQTYVEYVLSVHDQNK